MSQPVIATFNTGSSSIKFSLWAHDDAGTLGDCLLRGSIKDLFGTPEIDIILSDPDADYTPPELVINDPHAEKVISALAAALSGMLPDIEIVCAGHRIVHGGMSHGDPVLADEAILTELDTLSVFAPAHQPHNLAGVRAVMALWPDMPQSLSFDTAFHRTVPHVAQAYALPRDLTAEGIVRYGFHGLSYTHMAEQAPQIFGDLPHRRIVGLHLGSGASACAMLDGKSVATSMGLTALDGLPMATRCGDLDPGAVLHLIQERGMSADAVADLLYRKSGLLGVSGISSDMRTLSESDAPEAEEAIALYAYRVARETASLMGALEGLDAIIFSGGVGEHSSLARARICDYLAWTGLSLDADANATDAPRISAPDSRVTVAILPADEERVLAEDAARCLAAR